MRGEISGKKTCVAGNRKASAMRNGKVAKTRRGPLCASEVLATCAFLPFSARRPNREGKAFFEKATFLFLRAGARPRKREEKTAQKRDAVNSY